MSINLASNQRSASHVITKSGNAAEPASPGRWGCPLEGGGGHTQWARNGGEHALPAGHAADTAINGEPLAGDVLAGIRGKQHAQAFQVLVIAQAL